MSALINHATGHTCWMGEFLLRHCEGYRVFAAGRPIGYVDEIVNGDDGEPTALLVRTGEVFAHTVDIPGEAVLGIDADRERVLIAPLAETREAPGSRLRIPVGV